MAFNLVTGPASEPVSINEAKAHLRVDIAADDPLISRKMMAVRQALEETHGICMLTQTWDWYMDDFPSSPITIPKWPLQSVTSIKYTDEDDNESTYAAGNYRVDAYNQPGKIVLKSSSTWPSVALKEVNAVVIRFVAGWASMALLPEGIRQAVMLMLGDLYELREDTLVSERARVSAQNLNISKLLMMNYRNFNF